MLIIFLRHNVVKLQQTNSTQGGCLLRHCLHFDNASPKPR